MLYNVNFLFSGSKRLGEDPWTYSETVLPGLNILVIFTCVSFFKDIVQPKKRGVKRGTIRYVLTSYTIADIF